MLPQLFGAILFCLTAFGFIHDMARSSSNLSMINPTIVGLCASCRFVEVITSSKESTFYRCRLSETDPAFRKYPILPVLACRGYQTAERDAG